MTKACSECGGLKKVDEVAACSACSGRGIVPGTPPTPCTNKKCKWGQVKTGKRITCTNCQGSGWEPEIDGSLRVGDNEVSHLTSSLKII